MTIEALTFTVLLGVDIFASSPLDISKYISMKIIIKKRENERQRGIQSRTLGHFKSTAKSHQPSSPEESLQYKTLSRALDPRANGTWLSKLTE